MKQRVVMIMIMNVIANDEEDGVAVIDEDQMNTIVMMTGCDPE